MSVPSPVQIDYIAGLSMQLSSKINQTAKDHEQKQRLILGVIGMFSSDFKTDSKNKAGAENKLVQTVLSATAR